MVFVSLVESILLMLSSLASPQHLPKKTARLPLGVPAIDSAAVVSLLLYEAAYLSSGSEFNYSREFILFSHNLRRHMQKTDSER